MKTFLKAAALLTLLLAPLAAEAASSLVIGYSSGGSFGSGGCGALTLCGIGNLIIGIINNILVPVLFAIAFIVFLYGIAKAYIFSHGEPGAVADGHRLLLWGLIGFAAMISLWGLVNVVANTFGLSGYNTPSTPTYYPHS
jgi:hypothetical protein